MPMPVWLLALAAAAVSLGIEARLRKYKKEPSRRRVLGCEAARDVLDRSGAAEIAVESGAAGPGMKRLVLEEPLYRGSSLFDLAEAARRAALHLQDQGGAVLPEWRSRLWTGLEMLLILGWLALAAQPLGAGFRTAAAAIFAVFLTAALVDLPRQWEASERASFFLRQSGYFEIDELVKLRRILKGLRFRNFAAALKAPWDLAALWRKP